MNEHISKTQSYPTLTTGFLIFLNLFIRLQSLEEILYTFLDSGLGTTSGQSTLNTTFSAFGYQQQTTPLILADRYDTNGSLTCFNVSITDYDNPTVANRSSAQKVRR